MCTFAVLMQRCKECVYAFCRLRFAIHRRQLTITSATRMQLPAAGLHDLFNSAPSLEAG